MANLLVKGAQLLVVGAALSSLHGSMLDPAGIGLTLAQAPNMPDDPEPPFALPGATVSNAAERGKWWVSSSSNTC